MGTRKLQRRYKSLLSFRQARNKTKYLANCPSSAVHHLCESLYNFLFYNDSLGVEPKTVQQLKHQEARLLTLCAQATPLRTRRKILSEEKDLQNLISHQILPLIKQRYL